MRVASWFGKYSVFIAPLLFILTFGACDWLPSRSADSVLASVGKRQLVQSQIEDLVPPNASTEDSINTVQLYMERWIREAVVLNEAEASVSEDLDIERLVEDYRSSLIKHNYEKVLVETFLDSTIQESELRKYYEADKDQYRLANTIVKGQVAIVGLKDDDVAEVRSIMTGNDGLDYEALMELMGNKQTPSSLDTNWVDVDRILELLPAGTLSATSIKPVKREVNDDNYRYFIRIDEVLNKESEAPFAYAKDKIRRVLLHQRKSKLLKEKREEMYERELRNKNIKIYD